MDDLRRQGRYTLDDLAQAMAERMQAWSPGRAEMQRHLTRRQAIRLLNDDRLERAILLNADLPAADLGGSIVLPNARLLLSDLMECGGAKLTEAGFLNRKFVMQIGGKLDWPDFNWQELCAISKAVREEEVAPLWFLHGLLKLSRLAYVRRGVLHAGKRSRELIAPERSGALQAALFRTAWGDFNLAGLSRSHLAERMHRQANLALFMIGRLADDWIDSENLLHAAIVPDEEIMAAMESLPRYAFEGCILRPLRWFGLIEMRSVPTELEWQSRRELRKTPLFDRFLAFDAGPP
ncbi:MAG: hypothetical protein ACREEV_12110 [Dongiaceae bacterium]